MNKKITGILSRADLQSQELTNISWGIGTYTKCTDGYRDVSVSQSTRSSSGF
jgi:hypothetical protein